MTPLDKPVLRSTGVTILNRTLLLELKNSEAGPVLSFRLKGLRSSKTLNLEKLARKIFPEEK